MSRLFNPFATNRNTSISRSVSFGAGTCWRESPFLIIEANSLSSFDAIPWAKDRIAGQAALTQDIQWLEPAGASLAITADEHLLTRVLDNFLSNARRHANRLVQTSIIVEQRHCIIMVDDDGPGIPEQDRSRVFDAFVRLDESRGRKTGGHGLGLAIVAGIARAHRGEVKVESSPLGGARFLFRWPI